MGFQRYFTFRNGIFLFWKCKGGKAILLSRLSLQMFYTFVIFDIMTNIRCICVCFTSSEGKKQKLKVRNICTNSCLFYAASERGKAARCCGRWGDSCCWSWSPSCPDHAAHAFPTTEAWKMRLLPGTLASERSMSWRLALCCDCTAPSWASLVSGTS